MKNAALHNAFAIALLMLAASVGSVALRPTIRVADLQQKVDLETMIPKTFGQWKVSPSVVPLSASPDVQANLNSIYSQILLRSYVDPAGNLVMLLIAYGSDQRGDYTQVHRPEFCYTAQGFQLQHSAAGELSTDFGPLPVRRLVARQGRRNEPITYWITVGNQPTLPGVGRKLNQIAYGLAGKVADGMLIRASTLDVSEPHAYRVQEAFIKDMLNAMDAGRRERIIGKPVAGTRQ